MDSGLWGQVAQGIFEPRLATPGLVLFFQWADWGFRGRQGPGNQRAVTAVRLLIVFPAGPGYFPGFCRRGIVFAEDGVSLREMGCGGV